MDKGGIRADVEVTLGDQEKNPQETADALFATV
jgi:hypothetical protein